MSGAVALDLAGLGRLVDVLRARGYRVLGPQVRDDAVVYDELPSADRLPVGVGDEQAPGRYRLRERGDLARFGYAVGPHSWRRSLQVPEEELFRVIAVDDAFELRLPAEPAEPLALVGVRGCELAAIEVQDRVFGAGEHQDTRYLGRRAGAFRVAVECHAPAATCFCPSMGTGPAVAGGAELVLTEVLSEGAEPWYLARAQEGVGAEVLAEVGGEAATPAQVEAAEASVARAAETIERVLDAEDLPTLFEGGRESKQWEEVASRCLDCTSCTLVCPTCFCNSTEDSTDVVTGEAVRTRRWDSCFTTQFSHVHGGPVRSSVASRYRQWISHKLGTWAEQFGVAGCVGCGRCITWCPPGIDITEEVAKLRGSAAREMGDAS